MQEGRISTSSIFRDMMSSMMPFPSMMSEFCGSVIVYVVRILREQILYRTLWTRQKINSQSKLSPVKQRVLD